jgi:glutathione S-transferase
VTSRILPGFHPFLQFQEEGQVKEARREFLGYLKDFTHAMDAEGPSFYGRKISMPDVALAPWAVKLWILEHFKA